MKELLSVIVQTSPIPSHPSIALLEALFRSFDHVDGIRECRIIIVADGYDEIQVEQKEGLKRGKVSSDTARRYRQHLERLQNRLEEVPFGGSSKENGSVELVILSDRHGSAKAIDSIVRTKVETPFLLICQHDNLFVADVPLRSILSAMKVSPWIKALHFTATSTMNYMEKVWKRYAIQLEPRSVPELDGHALVPLVFWYGRTHVARTDYYRDFVLNRNLKAGDHLEELLGERQLCDIRSNGMAVHDSYGNYVLDQGKEVLYHLSGRRARAAQGKNVKRGDCGSEPVRLESKGASSNEVEDDAWKEQYNLVTPINSTTPCGSFTTARSSHAIVPGLDLAPEQQPAEPPTGRFKGDCFHCGVKGHSYRFCPDMTNELHETEILDLT